MGGFVRYVPRNEGAINSKWHLGHYKVYKLLLLKFKVTLGLRMSYGCKLWAAFWLFVVTK